MSQAELTPASEPVSLESDTVSLLTAEGREFHIVGTAHVSQKSVDEVRAVIRQVKPDTVCVELCQGRFDALTRSSNWQQLDIFKVIREGKTLFLMANLAIAGYQRRMGERLGVKPGAELLAAVETAEEVGAKLVLVDRDVHATLKRTWANLGFWTRMRMAGSVFAGMFTKEEVSEEDIEALKEKAQLSEMLSAFAEAIPGVKEPLIDERDQYLMSGIEDAPGKSVVGVVGAAHVPGMKSFFGKPVNRARLDEIPPPAKWTKWVKWVLPATIVAAFAFGVSGTDGKSWQEMLLAWVLPNSVMAALLTGLARGKFLSVVTSFFSSPITSLNPLVGTGMVVGLLEAYLRKPTVEDLERINDDVTSLKGVFRNPATHTLVVALAANTGSALGSYVGGAWLLGLVIG